MKRISKKRREVEYSYAFETPSFPLAIRMEENAGDIVSHQHENFSELVIVVKGHATHLVARRKYPLIAGDVFVIGEKKNHAYTDTSDFTYCNVLMNMKSLGIPLADLLTRPGFQSLFVIDSKNTSPDRFSNRFRLTSEQLEPVLRKLKTIQGLIPNRRFEAIAQFMLLICMLCDCYENNRNMQEFPMRMGQLIARMERHCEHQFSIGEMCRTVNMSRAAFYRQFTECYGLPPIQFLIRMRINKSMQLLCNTNLSCGEIARQCGFTDASYFTFHFHRAMGITPSGYRKIWKQEQVEVKSGSCKKGHRA
ncbi:MAG: helix-turn-helix domain-containing protein [Victivallales bacterium]|nr:helix-turn-helix domain-containing protein [Victivallales bacterium]